MMKKKKVWKIIVPIGIILFIILAVLFGRESTTTATTAVKTYTIEQGPLQAYVNSTGTVLSQASYNISSDVTGEIIAIHKFEGDLVLKGDVLLELDPSDIQAQIKETEIQLEIARESLVQIANSGSSNYSSSYKNALVTLNSASKAYDDAKALFDAGVYSQSQVDTAYDAYLQSQNNYSEMRAKYNNENSESEIRIQELRIESYENSLEQQKNKLADMKIISPIDGIVTGTSATLMSYANPGAILFTVENIQDLKVEINVSQYDIHRIQLGQPVVIKADGIDHETYEGIVSHIGSRAINKVLRASQEMVIEVEVEVLSKDTPLKPNFSARTEIETANIENALVLPYEAIYIEKDGTIKVFTVVEGKVVEHIITKGVEGDLMFEGISSTLQSGDQLILSPTEQITDGLDVTVLDVE